MISVPHSSIATPEDGLPDSLQPLSAQLTTAIDITAHAKNTVKNVLDSYTGRFDVLAEAVQNAMDALEKRWADTTSFGAELPRLVVRLDANADTITVWDNGVGIESTKLLTALVPHMSPKSLDPSPTRGHKGVGTTFLAYGHPEFAIRTKTDGYDEVGYRIVGGLGWVKGQQTTEPPVFERLHQGDVLQDTTSGTEVKVAVGEETRFGRLKTAQYNKLDTWSLVLRTFTAVGTLTIGLPSHKRPGWLKHLQVELQLAGMAGAGTTIVDVGFQLPHLDASSKISLQQLQSGGAPANTRYELLYTEMDSSALELTLATQLQALSDSDQPEDQEKLNLFRAYDTAVYASWSYKNTWYEDLYRTRIAEEAKRYQYNNVRSGLLMTSVGMPIGEVTDHPYVIMKPEYKRRLFVVVGFNENYSPDLGRKTIPSADRALLDWLEREVQNLFLKHVSRLMKSNDDSAHNSGTFSEAKEQLVAQSEDLRKKHDSRRMLGINLALRRAPMFESELVTMFGALVATGRLPGYTLVAVPGSSSRYDGLFDFVTDQFESQANTASDVPLGISVSRATGGHFSRKSKWLEFKLRLEDLLEDFTLEDGNASKKYFDLLDLAIVWTVPTGDAIGDYDMTAYQADSWHERNFYGATHWLATAQGQHRVEVMCVQDLLRIFASQVTPENGA